MPRFSPRQIITTVSTIYLIFLTALAAYALHRINALSLPIPNAHSAFTLALPALAGIAVESLTSFRLRMQHQQQNTKNQRLSSSSRSTETILHTLLALFLVLESALATLSGTHVAPLAGLWCPLHERWQKLFQAKQAAPIRAIQDALECCGLVSVRDMAWPFPGGGQGEGGVCSVRYGRDRACLGPWREEERRVAMMLLFVPVGVFLWKAALFFLLPMFFSSEFGASSDWLPSAIRLPIDHNNSHGTSQNQNRRQAITFHRDVEEQQQRGDDEEEGESSSLQQEVDRLNQDSNLATRVEGGRRGGHGLVEREQENGWANE